MLIDVCTGVLKLVELIKANVIRRCHLFSIILFSVYLLPRMNAMLNFIGMGYQEHEASKSFSMKNTCPQWDSNS